MRRQGGRCFRCIDRHHTVVLVAAFLSIVAVVSVVMLVGEPDYIQGSTVDRCLRPYGYVYTSIESSIHTSIHVYIPYMCLNDWLID